MSETSVKRGVTPLSAVLLGLVGYTFLALATLELLFASGFAMPLWPAAGFALGLVLVVGPWSLPGIALGSLAANLVVGLETAPEGRTLAMALHLALVGVGAAAQAGLGAWLVRRATGAGRDLLASREIVLFLVLGGPVACLLNATVATAALGSAELFGAVDPIGRWWTWWLGDVSGVFLFAPVAVGLLRRREVAWSARVLPLGLTLCASALLLSLLLRTTIAADDERVESELARLADMNTGAVARAVENAEKVAANVARYLERQQTLDADTFRYFVLPTLQDNPAMDALSWNPVVPAEELAPGAPIWELADERSTPVSGRAEYVPVRLIEPLETNAGALGFDVASEPTRREALLRARVTERPAATAGIELVQGQPGTTGVLVFAPVRSGRALRGYAVAVLRIGVLLDRALSVSGELFSARLTDTTAGVNEPLGWFARDAGAWGPGPIRWTRTLAIGGRTWEIELVPTAASVSRRRAFLSAGTTGVGVLLAGLVSALSLLLSGQGLQERQQLRVLNLEMKEREKAESELSRAKERAEHQANHDSVTGLPNRRAFERLAAELADAARTDGHRHALAFIDLDQFKLVNDTVGHVAGDALLKQAAGLLQGHIRTGDTLARIGGDEFGLLLPHCPLDQAVATTERLVDSLASHRFVWAERPFAIGASVGLVGISADSGPTSSLLAHADVACYAAKEAGRGCVRVYEGDDDAARHRHAEMITAANLRDAIDAGRLRLVRQPILDLLRPDAPVRYEVLVRMVRQDGRIVAPSSFIPAAERFGMVADLDRWVVSQAFAALATWPAADTIAINLSGDSLADPRFQSFVEEALAQQDFAPGRVGFEITETAAIRNLSAAVDFIGSVRARGCRVALDDFGSGMASFGYLKNLPVDALKIDGSFIRDIVDPTQRILVRAIHDLAQALDLVTVAEGAETDEAVAVLRELGIRYGQGWALGRPEPLPGSSDSD